MGIPITYDRLKEILEYSPTSGLFFSKKINNHVGALDEKGYIRVLADGKLYRAHRLAWLYMTGQWPQDQVDHINGNKADNRWENLRDVDQTLNMLNKHKPHHNNRSGVLGVSELNGKYYPRLRIDGKLVYLGSYASKVEAKERYESFKQEVLDNYQGMDRSS